MDDLEFADKQHPPPSNQPSSWVCLAMIVLSVTLAALASSIFVGLEAAFRGVEPGVEATLVSTLLGFAGVWLGLGVGALLVSGKAPGKDFVDLVGLKLKAIPDIPLGILIGIFGQLVLVPLVYLPYKLFDSEVGDRVGEPARALVEVAQGPGLIPFAIAVCVISPLVEEVFFRGAVLNALLRWGQKLAAVASALLFALVHFQKVQFPALFLFGLLLAVVALKTRRLGMTIAAHCAFNAVTVVLLITNG